MTVRISAVRNLIFDVDGTLIDSKRDIAAAQLHVLRQLGIDRYTPEDIYPLIGKPLAEIFSLLLPPEMYGKIPEAHAMYVAYYRAHALRTTQLFPGVEATIAELHRRGIRLAVATTKSTQTTVRVLEHFGIAHYFAQMQGTDQTPFKPDPYILNKILSDQSWTKEESMMVGDTDKDIDAGKNAGMRTCGVTYGSLSRAEIEKLSPDVVIDRFDGLLSLAGKEETGPRPTAGDPSGHGAA